MNGEVDKKNSEKLKKKSMKFYKYFPKFSFFSEFFGQIHYFIHFLNMKFYDFKKLLEKNSKKLENTYKLFWLPRQFKKKPHDLNRGFSLDFDYSNRTT